MAESRRRLEEAIQAEKGAEGGDGDGDGDGEAEEVARRIWTEVRQAGRQAGRHHMVNVGVPTGLFFLFVCLLKLRAQPNPE